MSVTWRCRQCGNTWSFVHKDGQQQTFSEVLRLAQQEEAGGFWSVTFYCPTCDAAVGAAQFPTGDPSPMLVEGEVNIFYYFEPIDADTASVAREIPIEEDEVTHEGI